MVHFNRYSILILTFITIFCNKIYCDICDVCSCQRITNNIQTNDTRLDIYCNGLINLQSSIELENIQWPTDQINIEAHFNNMKYTFLPKLLGINTVTLIDLNDNLISSITNNPFQYFKNVEHISLANNSIQTLPKDLFKSTSNLHHINLSYNIISDIDNDMLSKLKLLRNIDLSYNDLTTISSEFLATLKNVESLNLAGNRIYFLQTIDDTLPEAIAIKELQLQKNKLTVISSKCFASFQSIEILNLSENSIKHIERDSFADLPNLRVLDLSSNMLEELLLMLPDSLEYLTLSSNNLKTWPTQNLPKNLMLLEIQNNHLYELFANIHPPIAEKLTYLNVSSNAIEELPKISLPTLEVLDLSRNNFETIPENVIRQMIPQLQHLIMDENPISDIHIENKLPLQELSLKNMPLLEGLEMSSLGNLDGRGKCLSLTISNCKLFSYMHPSSFENLQFCKLDLSYNNLTIVPENLTDWQNIPGVIDLQGNPLRCTCTDQWMIEKILKKIYSKKSHQMYLAELRCASPDQFAGRRFVKYMKRIAAFCNPSQPMTMARYDIDGNIQQAGFNFDELRLSNWVGFTIVMALAAVTLLIGIWIIAIIIRNYRRQKLDQYNHRLYEDYDY